MGPFHSGIANSKIRYIVQYALIFAMLPERCFVIFFFLKTTTKNILLGTSPNHVVLHTIYIGTTLRFIFPAQISPLNSRLIDLDGLLYISTWMCNRHLKFNIFKTKLLVFSPKNCMQSVLFELISTLSFQLLNPKIWELLGPFFHTLHFIHRIILHLHHGSDSYHFHHLYWHHIGSLHHHLSPHMLQSLMLCALVSTLNPVSRLSEEAKQNDPVKM